MILTPDRRLRVFISSTLDLTSERAAARRAIDSLNLTAVMFEAGARPHPPRALYRAYVEQSDVFVAIYSRRYGWTAPGMDVSGLEDEYSLSEGMPRLVYIQAGVEREPELTAFLDRVRDDGLSYRPFTSPTELEAVLKDDLVVVLTERFHAARPPERPPTARPAALLPIPPSVFVGRDEEVVEVRELLERDQVHLVTLVGTGGIGKTRLAIAAAHAAGGAFDGGTFFVPLASVREPALVPDAVAASLGVAACDGCSAVSSIADHFGQRRALLVLDNFEHVIDAAPLVTELLARCPHVTILVTSRAPLRVRSEHEVQVRPLSIPPGAADASTSRGFPAVELFVEAARAIRPEFVLDDTNADTVVEICRELDGLPLAIELAAAMMRVLSPAMLLERLRRGSDLGEALRDLPERHRGLRSTIAWSYELLDQAARELLAELSVFRGGFALEHVERVCAAGDGSLDVLARLVEHSLVRADLSRGGGVRFSMLGTIRRFAAERLDERGTRRGVVARHAELFTQLVSRVGEPNGRTTEVLDAIEADLDNVRASFARLLEDGDTGAVASAIGASWWFWWIRGYVNEGKLWADRALSSDLPGATRARVRSARAMLAIWSGEYDLARATFVDAARDAERSGDSTSAAYVDIGAGLVAALTESYTAGAQRIRQGVARFDAMGDDLGATTGLAALAWVQAITRQFDPTPDTLLAALERAHKAGSPLDEGIAEAALAQFHLVAGEHAAAVTLLAASLEHLATARHIGSTILTLEVIAELALASGLDQRAATLLGSTAAVRSSMGTRAAPAAAARLGQLMATGHGRLGDEFDAAYEAGSRSGFADAVALGREVLAALAPRP